MLLILQRSRDSCRTNNRTVGLNRIYIHLSKSTYVFMQLMCIAHLPIQHEDFCNSLIVTQPKLSYYTYKLINKHVSCLGDK